MHSRNQNRQEQLHDFFREYAALSLGGDPASLAGRYEASFLAAGPKGAAAFKNDETFLSWLRELHEFNAQTGMTSMSVDEVHEIPVGAGYSLATVSWAATFDRTGAAPIRFKISYLLHDVASRPRIAAYISHDDQEDVMRAHGLL